MSTLSTSSATDRFSLHNKPINIPATPGASKFGISNLTLLAGGSHKFESKYIETLVGDPLSQAHLLQERSPIYHLENVSTPVIFLHGTEDARHIPACRVGRNIDPKMQGEMVIIGIIMYVIKLIPLCHTDKTPTLGTLRIGTVT